MGMHFATRDRFVPNEVPLPRLSDTAEVAGAVPNRYDAEIRNVRKLLRDADAKPRSPRRRKRLSRLFARSAAQRTSRAERRPPANARRTREAMNKSGLICWDIRPEKRVLKLKFNCPNCLPCTLG